MPRRPKNTPPPAERFSWESRTTTRVGLSAALVSAGLGVLFAVLQAQGWKVPKPLAIALVVLLGVVIVAAATWFLYEVVRALRRLYEHLITTPSWVESEPPGQLDFAVDGTRAMNRYTKELNKLTRRTARLNKKVDRTSRLIVFFGRLGHPRLTRFVANRPSRYIARNGAYIQKRADLFRELVRDIHRNYEGFISILPLGTDAEIQAAKAARDTLSSMEGSIPSAIQSNIGYRDSVRDLEVQNPSRALRVACRQLAEGLDAVVLVFKQHQKRSGELVRSFDQKLGSH